MSHVVVGVTTDLTQWPVRHEVAEELGISPTSLKRLQRAGVLHPVQDAEGTNRYNPEEVKALIRVRESLGRMPSSQLEIDGYLRNEAATFGISKRPHDQKAASVETPIEETVIPALPTEVVEGSAELKIAAFAIGVIERLLAGPRERLDRRIFDMLDKQGEIIEKLSATQERYFTRMREQDGVDVDRRVAAHVLEKESEVRTEAMKKAASTLERLVSGGKVPLSPSTWDDTKLGELASLDVWSPEEARAIAAELAQRAQKRATMAKTNGNGESKSSQNPVSSGAQTPERNEGAA